MRKTLNIAQKELQVLFRSSMAYILLIACLVIFHYFFFLILDQNREATLRDMFQLMEFLFVFIIPLLTMKSFAEEKSTGTIEFLMTTPTTSGTLVLGKYLGNLMFFSFLLFLTLSYYGILEYFGHPDRLSLLTGYVGIWLEAAFFIAIGNLCSSLTKNQVAAAMMSYVFLFGLYFSTTILKYLKGTAAEMVQIFGTSVHLANFSDGLITTSDIVYYMSGIAVCLILTKLNLDFQKD